MTFFIHSSFIHSFFHIINIPAPGLLGGESKFKRVHPHCGSPSRPRPIRSARSGIACSPGSPGHVLPWSLGHVHLHPDLRVTYPWGLCYVIPISRSCVLPHSYIRVAGPLGLQITPPPPTSGSRAPLCPSRDYIPCSIPVTRATPASRSCTLHPSLRVTCLPGLGAHDIPSHAPLHT